MNFYDQLRKLELELCDMHSKILRAYFTVRDYHKLQNKLSEQEIEIIAEQEVRTLKSEYYKKINEYLTY